MLQAVQAETKTLKMERIPFPIHLAQTLMEGVAVEDDTGHLVFVNRTLEQLLGYRSGELIGQPWTVLLPGQREGDDRPATCYEIHLSRRDRTTVPVLAAAWRLRVSTDHGPRRLSVFTDFADEASPGSPLIQSTGKGGWDHHLASMAHELNNPLTIINIQSQLLTEVGSSIPMFGEHLAIIQDQVQRMKRIIEDLRLSSHFHGPQLESTDINALVRRTLDIQEYQTRAADVQVTTALSPIPIQIEADPYQLQQVFVNLIDNACQALAKADYPRKLRVATIPVPQQNGQASRILIRFYNNGPAIPANVMPHIFVPFFTTKKQDQGTGLGLTICEQIVQAHCGRIWAENGAESGVTFVVELPLSDAAAASPESPRALPGPGSCALRNAPLCSRRATHSGGGRRTPGCSSSRATAPASRIRGHHRHRGQTGTQSAGAAASRPNHL